MSGDFTARYSLDLGDGRTPNENQSQAYSLALSGEARPGGAVGPGAPATYTLQYRNVGHVDIQDVVRISVTIPSNLDATCNDITGDYDDSPAMGIIDYGDGVCLAPVSQEGGYNSLYHLPAGASGTLTLTGEIENTAPTGPVTVTGYIKGDMQPNINESDNWAYPSVLVDATPPEPEFLVGGTAQTWMMHSIQAPLQHTYVAPTATVAGLADDNRSGTAQVEIDLDDGYGWRDASGTTFWSSLLSGLEDGDTRTLRLRATAAAGNVSDVETLAITVDGLPPQSAIGNPAAPTALSLGDTLVITGTSADARSGVARVELSTDGGQTWPRAAYDADTGRWTRVWQPQRTGAYTITVRAMDAVGNWETPSEEVVVTVSQDTTTPTVTGTNPDDGATDVPRNQPLVVDFSEAMDTGSISTLIAPTLTLTSTWSNGDTRLTLTHDDFAATTRYTITVAAGRDLAGNPLSNAPYTWVFTTSTTVATEADLALGKGRVGVGEVTAGERITYTFTITNHSPTTPVTATVVDTFSDAAALVGVSGPGCVWTFSTTVVTRTVTNVTTGSVASLELVVTTSDTYSGTLANSAVVAPAGVVIDPNPANDSAGPVVVIVRGRYHIYLPLALKYYES